MYLWSYGQLLRVQGFLPFLITEFLGAFNDNFYKMLISLLLVHHAINGEILAITGLVFVLPGLFFNGYAGYLADRYSKRTVLIVTKSTEIIAMLLAFFVIGTESAFLMLSVLFLTAIQSTFFGPAKYGIVPETIPLANLSRANGLLQLTTFMAIILGGVFAGFLLHFWEYELYKIGLVMIFIACLGTASSFYITPVPAASRRTSSRNPWHEIIEGLKECREKRLIRAVIISLSFFWGVAIAAQFNLIAFGHFVLHWSPVDISFMQMMLALGIAVGSLLAGKFSGDQIEPGLIPLGTLGMTIWLSYLSFFATTHFEVFAALFLIGFSAGYYVVPLNALLQELPDKEHKGQIIGTSNFVNAAAMALSSGLMWFIYAMDIAGPDTLMAFFALLMLGETIILVKTIPDFFLRFFTWLITHTIYRVKIIGDINIPRKGAALLVCNHVSYVDGMILSTNVPRFIRYLVYKDFYDYKAINWLFRLVHAIPIKGGEGEEVNTALQKAQQELQAGHVVCIFAEGSITRTGDLLPFHRGFERIMAGVDQHIPIIPVHIGQLWGSIFSYQGGKVLWKLPRHIWATITLSFGHPMPASSKAWQVRQAVQEMETAAYTYRQSKSDYLPIKLLKSARWRFFSFCMVDLTNTQYTYKEFVSHALLLSKWLKQHYDDKILAILLPPSVQTAVMNAAVAFAGKTVMNLTYGRFHTDWQYFLEEGRIQVIFTSRAFIESQGIQPRQDMVFLEDLPFSPSMAELRVAALLSFLLPAKWVIKYYGALAESRHSPAAILLSRGITTSVKAALLSHCTILANVEGASRIFLLRLRHADRILGVLPFSTGYGYTLTMWLPLLAGMGIVYYPQVEKDITALGNLASRYKATVLFDFIEDYQMYLDKMNPYRFSYLRYAVVVGDSVPDAFVHAFREQFGIELLPSYGCVEMGALVSLSVPDVRMRGRWQRGQKMGSVGDPLPGISVRVVDPQTGAILPPHEVGVLWVKGPGGCAQGYLGDASLTEAAFREGWYITGDLMDLDNDGFLFFRGRLA